MSDWMNEWAWNEEGIRLHVTMFSRQWFLPTIIKTPSPFTSQSNSSALWPFSLDICFMAFTMILSTHALVTKKRVASLYRQHKYTNTRTKSSTCHSMRVKAIQLLPFQHITILKFHVFCVSFLMVSFFGVVMLFFITWIILFGSCFAMRSAHWGTYEIITTIIVSCYIYIKNEYVPS